MFSKAKGIVLEDLFGCQIHVFGFHSKLVPSFDHNDRLADLVEYLTNWALIDFMQAATHEYAFLTEQGLIVHGQQHERDQQLSDENKYMLVAFIAVCWIFRFALTLRSCGLGLIHD